MSRSINTDLINPAKHFIEWKGEKGILQYYQKSIDDSKQGENIEVPIPFRFLVLDCLSTIKGYSDADQSGYWSNEIRDLKKEELIVKTKKGTAFKGLYSAAIASRDTIGCKYCQSVYIAYWTESKEMIIANLQLTGAAVSSWIEFRKQNKIYEGAIEIVGKQEATKGKTIYQIPVFKKITTTQETDEIAKDLDVELQEYLTMYFKRNRDVIADNSINEPEIAPNGFMPRSIMPDIERKPETKIDEDNDLPF